MDDWDPEWIAGMRAEDEDLCRSCRGLAFGDCDPACRLWREGYTEPTEEIVVEPDTATPECVQCHRKTHVRESGSTFRAFWCGSCRIEFEAEDDGDIGYGLPEKRLERRERKAERR